jgi:hypothetical protein
MEKLGIHGVAGLTQYAIGHDPTTEDRDPVFGVPPRPEADTNALH